MLIKHLRTFNVSGLTLCWLLSVSALNLEAGESLMETFEDPLPTMEKAILPPSPLHVYGQEELKESSQGQGVKIASGSSGSSWSLGVKGDMKDILSGSSGAPFLGEGLEKEWVATNERPDNQKPSSRGPKRDLRGNSSVHSRTISKISTSKKGMGKSIKQKSKGRESSKKPDPKGLMELSSYASYDQQGGAKKEDPLTQKKLKELLLKKLYGH